MVKNDLIIEDKKERQIEGKVPFYPILQLEPKGFKEFVGRDFDRYFKKQNLNLIDTTHCDYSRVFELAK